MKSCDQNSATDLSSLDAIVPPHHRSAQDVVCDIRVSPWQGERYSDVSDYSYYAAVSPITCLPIPEGTLRPPQSP